MHLDVRLDAVERLIDGGRGAKGREHMRRSHGKIHTCNSTLGSAKGGKPNTGKRWGGVNRIGNAPIEIHKVCVVEKAVANRATADKQKYNSKTMQPVSKKCVCVSC